MHLPSLSILAGLAAVATAVSTPSNHVLHEKRAAEPKHWSKRDAVDSSVVLPMRIGLTQQNLDKGHDMLMEV